MTNRPNIVLLVGEDTGRHLGCYGERIGGSGGDTGAAGRSPTPHLDTLAAEGARFDRAYSVAPVCAPSRCCMVSGCYPWAIGTHQMRSTLVRPPGLFTQELRRAGYYVSWPTKTDFNFDPPTDFRDTDAPWWSDPAGSLGASSTAAGRPFFAFRNFSVTHESSMWDVVEGQPGSYQGWIDELPEDLRVDPAGVRVPAYLPDVPEVRLEIARYFESLALQDIQVGQTLRALDDAGLRENTIVFYLSDHGRGLAREKRWCYDAGLHLPLLVRWPGQVLPGSVSTTVVSWVDLAPTFLACAGVAIPAHYQGRAFLTAAGSHSKSGSRGTEERRYAFSGRDRMDETFDRVRTVTDGRYRLIRNDFPQLPYAQRNTYQQTSRATQVLRKMDAESTLVPPADVYMQRTKPPIELYDADTDPDMVHNLADDPTFAAVRDRSRSALEEELRRFGDLGETDETDLVARGLVTDRLTTDYRPRIKPLPEPYHTRTGPTSLTLNEAEARGR